MRIQCPTCDTTYDLPEERVVAGRAVRCARCGTDWTPIPRPLPAPEVDMPEPPSWAPFAAAGPERSPVVAAPSRFQRPTERQLVLGGWVLSAVVLVLLGWAAIGWRDGIMRAWPPSARAYAALGLAGPARP